MAHSLDIKVIAEGVENNKQLDVLKSIKSPPLHTLNCDEFQGYLFSKPVPPDEFIQILKIREKAD